MNELEDVIEAIIQKSKNSPNRLDALADFIRLEVEKYGLPKVEGGSSGERLVEGLARSKKWDISYAYFEKVRLIISLKSLWENASGVVPNRIDDVIGETANVQQMFPEVVTGYVILFDEKADSIRREDKKTWSAFFEEAIKKLTIRKAPIWNQGLLEGTWFVQFDSRLPYGERILYPEKAEKELRIFILSLLKELKLREPAIPFTSEFSKNNQDS